jgi:hypothetical protein
MKYKQEFRDYLSEIYGGTLEICGYEYDYATVFEQVDPIAFRQTYLNWLDSENLQD